MTTKVIHTDAKYNRYAYLYLKDNKVVFDCSDEEYGPIEFDIETLRKALEEHDRKKI